MSNVQKKKGGKAVQNQGVQRPPGQGQSRGAKQRKNRQLKKLLASQAISNSNSGMSLSDLSFLSNSWNPQAFSSFGASTQGSNYSTTNPRAGKKVGKIYSPETISYQSAHDDAGIRYMAAVFDPQNAPSDVKLIEDGFTQATASHKFSIPFRFSANNNGDFCLRFRPYVEWTDPMLDIFNDNTYNPDEGTQAVNAVRQFPKVTDIAANMILDWRVVCGSLTATYVDRRDAKSGMFFSGSYATDHFPTTATLNTDQIDELPISDHYTVDFSPEVIYAPKDGMDKRFRGLAESANRSTYYLQGVGLAPNAKMRGLLTLCVEYNPSAINKIATTTSATSSFTAGQIDTVIGGIIDDNKKYLVSPDGPQNVYADVLQAAKRLALDAATHTVKTVVGGAVSKYDPFGVTKKFINNGASKLGYGY